MNPFLILYFLLIFVYMLGVSAILYHLLKFQLHKKNTFLTSFVFLAGACILLLISIVIAFQVDWSELQITL